MSLDINRPVRLVKTLALFYGEEWLTWTPETLQAVLETQFQYAPEDLDLNKIEALREAIRSDGFARNPLLFEKLVRAFNGLAFTETVWEPVSASELAYGLHVLGQVVGHERIGSASESVLAYMATCLEDDNVIWGPASLGFDLAQDEIEGACQAEHGLIDDCAAIWPFVEAAFFAHPNNSEAFFRETRRIVQSYVATAAIGGTGYDPDRAAPAERRPVVARSLVACATALVSLRARGAAPTAPLAVSAARQRRLDLAAALAA